VDASPTVFYAQPDGVRSLVRFEVTGIDAPAGRLRVFDRNRRLLGTAGVLRATDRMVGELWLDLQGPTSVVSELEAPGLRGPFRTAHRLSPGRRWTIHLITVADPAGLARSLNTLRPIHRAVQTSLYRTSSVVTNPLPVSSSIAALDHVPFLQMAERGLEVEREYAIPMGAAAYVPPGVYLPKTAAMVLGEIGVRVMVCESGGDTPYEWWELPGGSRTLVVSVPNGSTPEALGFQLSQNEMTGRVESWLSTTALLFSPDAAAGTAVVLNSDADALSGALASLASWNSRFAFPRIVVGNELALLEELESGAVSTPLAAPRAIHQPVAPGEANHAAVATMRAHAAEARTHDLTRVFCSAVSANGSDLKTMAAYIATAVPGTVVLNPSPYARSDLVRMSDGSERLATDVPGIGYAFFPDEGSGGEAGGWHSIGSTRSAQGELLRVTIDGATGAISSLVQTPDGREWVRPDSAGLNAVQEARLERVTTLRLGGVATRLLISRRVPRIGTITITVTLYDGLPWLDITNEAENTSHAEIRYEYHFNVDAPRVSWEIPAGSEETPAPVPVLEHLRWISIADHDGTLMFRGLEALQASVEADGTLISYSSGGVSRYRLTQLARYSSRDMPWVFGWDTEPMAVARARPNGMDLLPRFGSLITVEQVGVAVPGVRPAADGYGIIVYLQETLGVSRPVPVGPAVLRFRNAEKVDFLERYKEEIPVRADGVAQIPLPANGVVAVRLSGLELA
jgi:hypothetical protein